MKTLVVKDGRGRRVVTEIKRPDPEAVLVIDEGKPFDVTDAEIQRLIDLGYFKLESIWLVDGDEFAAVKEVPAGKVYDVDLKKDRPGWAKTRKQLADEAAAAEKEKANADALAAKAEAEDKANAKTREAEQKAVDEAEAKMKAEAAAAKKIRDADTARIAAEAKADAEKADAADKAKNDVEAKQKAAEAKAKAQAEAQAAKG